MMIYTSFGTLVKAVHLSDIETGKCVLDLEDGTKERSNIYGLKADNGIKEIIEACNIESRSTRGQGIENLTEIDKPPFILTNANMIKSEPRPNGCKTWHKDGDVTVVEITEFWLTRWFIVNH